MNLKPKDFGFIYLLCGSLMVGTLIMKWINGSDDHELLSVWTIFHGVIFGLGLAFITLGIKRFREVEIKT